MNKEDINKHIEAYLKDSGYDAMLQEHQAKDTLNHMKNHNKLLARLSERAYDESHQAQTRFEIGMFITIGILSLATILYFIINTMS